MASSRLYVLCFGWSLLLLLGACEESTEVRGAGDGADESREEKEMEDPSAWSPRNQLPVHDPVSKQSRSISGRIEALQEVLEKLRSSQVPLEKKLGWVPSCDAGEHCAVRKGSRIGKLCNCPRRTSCNMFILKCL
ncbi:cocaine- and amphetamine-regulated transcript protein-like isoform X1 [Paroedura picta]|uniref:cocaine- and amphetamine-regulated transcript protein-like isoform X1 n=1 Tax=Paroedura picta TaxID=143630 RepID=UPI0040563E0D